MKREIDNHAAFLPAWKSKNFIPIFQPFLLKVAQGLGERKEGRPRTG